MDYIAVFFTHSGAIKYHRHLKSTGIENETLPIPRKLSSNCGIGVKFYTSNNINEMITADVEKIYEIKNGIYDVVYEE